MVRFVIEQMTENDRLLPMAIVNLGIDYSNRAAGEMRIRNSIMR